MKKVEEIIEEAKRLLSYCYVGDWRFRNAKEIEACSSKLDEALASLKTLNKKKWNIKKCSCNLNGLTCDYCKGFNRRNLVFMPEKAPKKQAETWFDDEGPDNGGSR